MKMVINVQEYWRVMLVFFFFNMKLENKTRALELLTLNEKINDELKWLDRDRKYTKLFLEYDVSGLFRYLHLSGLPDNINAAFMQSTISLYEKLLKDQLDAIKKELKEL